MWGLPSPLRGDIKVKYFGTIGGRKYSWPLASGGLRPVRLRGAIAARNCARLRPSVDHGTAGCGNRGVARLDRSVVFIGKRRLRATAWGERKPLQPCHSQNLCGPPAGQSEGWLIILQLVGKRPDTRPQVSPSHHLLGFAPNHLLKVIAIKIARRRVSCHTLATMLGSNPRFLKWMRRCALV